MGKIILRRKGKDPLFTEVDDEFLPVLSKHRWHVVEINDRTHYVSSYMGSRKQTLLHRYIMELAIGRKLDRSEEIDHIDRDPLNNLVSNLRICTRSQNEHNVSAHSDNKSGYKGISFDNRTDKWSARICVNYNVIWSRRPFDNPRDAAEEYDLLAIKYAGEFAKLNFEDRRQEYIDQIEAGWKPAQASEQASKFEGITFNKSKKHSKNPWAADFWEHGEKVLHVGHFATEEEAVTERDLAAIKHFGEDAPLAYPHRRTRYIKKIRAGYEPGTKRKTSSKYVGVNFQPKKKTKPWRSYVERDGKRTYLGNFDTEDEANEARIKWLNQRSADTG